MIPNGCAVRHHPSVRSKRSAGSYWRLVISARPPRSRCQSLPSDDAPRQSLEPGPGVRLWSVVVRILVTGAAGFIGSHVVSAFAADGYAVTGLDALAPSVPADEPGADDAAAPSDQAASGSDDLIYADVRDIRADLRDAEAVATALRGGRPRLPSGGDGRAWQWLRRRSAVREQK